MKKASICIVWIALLLAGCSNVGKEAQARLDKAKSMYEANDLYAVKLQIDTIRSLYPGEVEVLKECLRLMRQVDLKECERNIAFCDSLIPIRLTEADSLKKGFAFEKDEQYEEIGNYIWKQQTVERNVQRSYIRAGVNEKGEMYLASVYYGKGALNHTSVRFSTKGDLFAETAAVPYDGGRNYRFTDLGMTSEIVAYKGPECEDAAKFIYANQKERIKAEYTGGKKYTLYVADGDKKAIAATYDLATVLSDIETMNKEKEKATKKIAYINAKLAGKETAEQEPPAE